MNVLQKKIEKSAYGAYFKLISKILESFFAKKLYLALFFKVLYY